MPEVDVLAINLNDGLVITSDNNILPITNMYDEDGDETDDVSEATWIVAGQGNTWWTVQLAVFEPERLN